MAFLARYDSNCERCGGPIVAGEDRIQRSILGPLGSWEHADRTVCDDIVGDAADAAERHYFDQWSRVDEIRFGDDPEPAYGGAFE